jgi:hypothetical protein
MPKRILNFDHQVKSVSHSTEIQAPLCHVLRTLVPQCQHRQSELWQLWAKKIAREHWHADPADRFTTYGHRLGPNPTHSEPSRLGDAALKALDRRRTGARPPYHFTSPYCTHIVRQVSRCHGSQRLNSMARYSGLIYICETISDLFTYAEVSITPTLSTNIIFGTRAGGTALAKFIEIQACVRSRRQDPRGLWMITQGHLAPPTTTCLRRRRLTQTSPHLSTLSTLLHNSPPYLLLDLNSNPTPLPPEPFLSSAKWL